MRRLIVNADDFGLTSGVNRAVLEAHRRGIVTSTTVMATGKAFSEAAALAGEAPGLGVGCHVVLLDGRALLPARTLVKNGEMRRSVGNFAATALLGRLNAEEIAAEAEAQIRHAQAAGLALTHLDSHKHAHALPVVLGPLLRAARACGLRAIRNPFERVPLTRALRRPGLWKRQAQTRAMRVWQSAFRRAVAEAGLVTTDGAVGVAATGALEAALLRELLTNLPPGTWELVCHPGYDDAELGAARTWLRESRERELELLTAPDLRVWLGEQGIELITFREL